MVLPDIYLKSIYPLCASIILLLKVKPIPEPSFLVVKYGMNKFSLIFSGTPIPLSIMVKLTRLLLFKIEISIIGLSISINPYKQLDNKLIIACSICCLSALIIVSLKLLNFISIPFNSISINKRFARTYKKYQNQQTLFLF